MKTKKDKKFNLKDFFAKNAKIVIPVALAILFIIIIVIVLNCTSVFSGAGNEIGNIRNYGYSVSDGKWYYFVAPDKEGMYNEVSRIKKDGSNRTKLYSTANTIVSLNVSGDYVYFVEVDTESNIGEEDLTDNRILRVKKDGTAEAAQLINDNDFANDCLEVYVVGDFVYYIGTDSNIYRMSIDGQDRELVAETGAGYKGITKDYILYNVKADIEEEYVTYIMDIDGSNPRPVLENTRLYTMGIYDDYVYYTNIDKNIYRTKIDSGEAELLYEASAYNCNFADDGYVYFFNYADIANADYTVCLYRLKMDGTSEEAERLYDLTKTSRFLNIVNGKAIFMDKSDTQSFIKMVDLEDKSVINLFEYTLEVEESKDTTTDAATNTVADTTDDKVDNTAADKE